MSAFTAINLNRLPPPQIVEPLDYETVFAELKSDLIARAPHLKAALDLESEDINKVLQVVAYREIVLRQRINDAAKATMLAFAQGSDLDHLSALFNVERALITPANDAATPPVPAVYEDDTGLRRRTQLALEGFSTAGPSGGYIFHALSADPDVKDVSVTSPAAGQVLVTILSKTDDGTAAQGLIDKVNAVLSADDVRPLCDTVSVQGATIKPLTIEAELDIFDGPDASVVLSTALKALVSYLDDNHKLGADITVSGIHSALHIQGAVRGVALSNPSADVAIDQNEAAYCDPDTQITLTIAGAT